MSPIDRLGISVNRYKGVDSFWSVLRQVLFLTVVGAFLAVSASPSAANAATCRTGPIALFGPWTATTTGPIGMTFGYDGGHPDARTTHANSFGSAPLGNRALLQQPSPCQAVGPVLAGRSSRLNDTGVATEAVNLNTGNVSVYTSTNGAGDVDYVGITNNIERRAGEHLAEKGIDINPIDGLESLSRADARSVEQVLIQEHGGPGGGQLLNKINSISTQNPIYSQSIQRGCALLAAVGHAAPNVCG